MNKAILKIMVVALVLIFALTGCTVKLAPTPASPADAQAEAVFTKARERMVEYHILGRGITDPNVLSAMTKVPRHRFVLEKNKRGLCRPPVTHQSWTDHITALHRCSDDTTSGTPTRG